MRWLLISLLFAAAGFCQTRPGESPAKKEATPLKISPKFLSMALKPCRECAVPLLRAPVEEAAKADEKIIVQPNPGNFTMRLISPQAPGCDEKPTVR